MNCRKGGAEGDLTDLDPMPGWVMIQEMAKKSAIRQHERANASTKDPKTHTYTTTYPASTISHHYIPYSHPNPFNVPHTDTPRSHRASTRKVGKSTEPTSQPSSFKSGPTYSQTHRSRTDPFNTRTRRYQLCATTIRVE